MSWAERLTPKDTEEIKPGLFIQKNERFGKVSYRQVYPAAWNGEIDWKTFLLGRGFIKSTIFFLILVFLAWGYVNDVGAYKDFYEDFQSNSTRYCTSFNVATPDVVSLDSLKELINETDFNPPPV